MKKMSSLLIFLLAITLIRDTYAAPIKVMAEEGVFVLDPTKEHLKSIQARRDWTVDHVSSEGYELFGPYGLVAELKNLRVPYLSLEALNLHAATNSKGYPSFREVESRLRAIVARCSNIMQMFSIGKTSRGRDLWVVKLSNNPSIDQLKPEIKYVSSMHGDEITGREVLQEFLDDICREYGRDYEVTQLVDSVEMFILPSMNPDGSELRRRSNARGVDLNRDFPDFMERNNENTPTGREAETQAMMRFQEARNFSLSANFHGGAAVVNYPWDTVALRHPEDGFFRDLSLIYASRVGYMKNSTQFKGGITNGYDWYEINGSMQDWSIYWYNDMQVTIEISGDKWPAYDKIQSFWVENRNALYAYFKSALQGAGFFASQAATGRVEVIRVNGAVEHRVGEFRFRNHEFYKVLAPGHYRFIPKADDQSIQLESFEIDVQNLKK